MIQVHLNATVRNIKTDNGTEFVNQTLKAYYEEVGISHQISIARTPQQKQPAVSTSSLSSTTINQDEPSTCTSQTTQETPSLVIPLSVKKANHDIKVEHMDNNSSFDNSIPEPSFKESSSQVSIPNNVHSINQPPEDINKWTKDHPIDNVISDPSRPVCTRHQLQDEAIFCYFDAFFSFVEPKSYKDTLSESSWIEAMQEELNEFVLGIRKNTLAEYKILFGARNHPPMLDKDLYDSWKSQMELYMQNREHGRMILELVENGPLIWLIVEENEVTKTKKYVELSAAEKIQADCDMKKTNIILQGLPADIYSLMNHHKVAKDLWERVQLLMQCTSLTKQERECFVIPVLSPGDDLIACLHKEIAFLTAVASLRVTLQQVQGRQGQSYYGTGYKSNVTSSWGNNASGQANTEDLDTYDSDCDDISNAKAILMANISNYGFDIISEEKANKEHNNESVTAKLERYKERVKTFKQRLNIDLSRREKMIDSQMDDM
uniref:Integrase catalytic domain-containing protein n=1 Tax=Tanacetum cinerariifolium TaxID=118510 RepID=A0A6L2LCA5_TANCI|nr:hypothetical protein [Tanacetum cinerariifolium]